MGGASYQLPLQHGLLFVSNPVYSNIYGETKDIFSLDLD